MLGEILLAEFSITGVIGFGFVVGDKKQAIQV
jgi:hypothetical protein